MVHLSGLLQTFQASTYMSLALHADTDGLAFILTAGTGGAVCFISLVSAENGACSLYLAVVAKFVLPFCAWQFLFLFLQAMFNITLLQLALLPTTFLSSMRNGQQML